MHICTFIFFLKRQKHKQIGIKSKFPYTTYPFLLLLLNLRDWKARIFPTILDLKSLLNYYNYTTNCPQVQENYLIGKGKTCTKYFSKYLYKNVKYCCNNMKFDNDLNRNWICGEKKIPWIQRSRVSEILLRHFLLFFFIVILLVCFSIISKYASTLFNAQRWHGIIDIIYFLSN